MSQDLYIGLLSGTSADAIDAVVVDLSVGAELVCSHSHPIPDHIKQIVFNLAVPGNNEIGQLQQIDQELGRLFSQAAIEVCEKAGILMSQVKAIGSHGQTVRHYPPHKEQLGYSLQIGDPNIIVETTGLTTVADFRRRDIAAGGHGAPLAPGLHNALFRSEKKDRIILNTGGIANITYLPATEAGAIGFDTGPANGLMDSWCQLIKQEPYDDKGRWADSGQVEGSLLEQLISHPYFDQAFPKSTGREDFNLPWLQRELDAWGKTISPEDVQATLLALSTITIGNAIEQIDPNKAADVFICGGGAHNNALCSALSKSLMPRTFENTLSLGVDPDWVEAIAFAWMAKQTLEYRTSNMPSVTGATKHVILGAIYPTLRS